MRHGFAHGKDWAFAVCLPSGHTTKVLFFVSRRHVSFYFLPERSSLPTFEPVSPWPCVTGKGYVVWNLAFAVCLWHTVNVPDPLVEAREGEEERTRK